MMEEELNLPMAPQSVGELGKARLELAPTTCLQVKPVRAVGNALIIPVTQSFVRRLAILLYSLTLVHLSSNLPL